MTVTAKDKHRLVKFAMKLGGPQPAWGEFGFSSYRGMMPNALALSGIRATPNTFTRAMWPS